MIGHTVLREIVGANFFFAAASPNLDATLGAVFFSFLTLLSLEQARAQDRQGTLLVLDLAAPFLTANDHPGWDVQNLHGCIGSIYPLYTRAARARHFEP